jgi:hypothetical protein
MLHPEPLASHPGFASFAAMCRWSAESSAALARARSITHLSESRLLNKRNPIDCGWRVPHSFGQHVQIASLFYFIKFGELLFQFRGFDSQRLIQEVVNHYQALAVVEFLSLRRYYRRAPYSRNGLEKMSLPRK